MYLPYEHYAAMGGSAFPDDSYPAAELRAEWFLDGLTLNRLRNVDWVKWAGEVERAMFLIVEALPSLDESYESGLNSSRLSSFSNGVNSFTFNGSDSDDDGAVASLAREVQSVLPVELCSACVRFNHAD